MKYELWNAHISGVAEYEVPELKEDRSNLSDFFSADVVGDKRFAQNYGGWPRSDVAEINSQVSLADAETLLRQLTILPSNDSNVGLSDAQIMLGHKSKYCQTAGEQVSWLESQLEIRDAQRAQLQRDSGKQEAIEFDSDSSSNDK